MTLPRKYCLALLAVAVLPSLIAAKMVINSKTHHSPLDTILALFLGLHFALVALVVVSSLRRNPEQPKWLWYVAALAYTSLGLVLAWWAISLLRYKGAPDTIIDPRLALLPGIGLLLTLWIYPSVGLCIGIATTAKSKRRSLRH